MQTVSSLLTDPASHFELCDCIERLIVEKRGTAPLSTYRLQFNKDFHFDDARKLVPYLWQLGISCVYASPILKARAGSQHGYDIIDHSQLNPEIGTEEQLRQFVAELKKYGMGLVLDTVPNHMGVGRGDNPWWQDVLQSGRASAYADFFDIDWDPRKTELRNKVLLPILGNPYGQDLEAGNIRVSFENDAFVAKYFDNVLPVDPQTYPLIFAPARELRRANGEQPAPVMELDALINALGRLPANDCIEPELVGRRQSEMPYLLEQLRRLAHNSEEVEREIQAALQMLKGTANDSRSFDALHALLEKQAYRLAFWRVSGEEINYRRFFDINDLVGLRMEDPRVFAATHKLIRKFLAEGLISGLRIDHPDGLLNPSQYFMRLQRLYAASRCLGPEPVAPLAADGIELDIHEVAAQHEWTPGKAPLYLLIEKIQERGEDLPRSWPVDGSVGYDFANLANGIFLDRRNERAFTNLYHRVTGATMQVDRLIYESKRLVMRRALASEVNVLADLLNDISNHDRHARDFTWSVLREAIRETIACFPVYRTYIDEGGHVSEVDREYIQQAIECAKRQNGTLAPAVFDFLRSILLLERDGGGAPIYGYRAPLYFTLKFQQLTGPVMAKGLEDTACYVYVRFVSVNEVGGSPANFGTSVSEFHRLNQQRAKQWPSSMLGTSTHDTKRSEDVRARLDVLSEIPANWAAQVMKWRRMNRGRKTKLRDGRIVPDNNEEYLLYQTLVGCWPLHMQGEAEAQSAVFLQRIQQYMEKAIHEAKVNLSWLNPNPDYVAAMNSFIEKILTPSFRGKPNFFLESLQKFLPSVMYFGCLNSLSQTLLKLTCPGVPDIFQGQELWDFSLVDPDNRRPVDFDRRSRAVADLAGLDDNEGSRGTCKELLSDYRDGRMKLWVTMRSLNCRREHKELFQTGEYIPLQVSRGREEHVVAFARQSPAEMAIVAVPRLSYTLMKGKEEPPLGAVWGDAELPVPPEAAGRRLRNVLTGEVLSAGHSALCREIFASFPVALFFLE